MRAFSGQLPPEEVFHDTWHSLAEAPNEITEKARAELRESNRLVRNETTLVRRPSWSAKFESPKISDDAKAELVVAALELDSSASSRLKRRPSWAAKFEGVDESKAFQPTTVDKLRVVNEARYMLKATASGAALPDGATPWRPEELGDMHMLFVSP